MSGLWGIVDTGVSYLDQPEEFLLVIIIVTLFNDHAYMGRLVDIWTALNLDKTFRQKIEIKFYDHFRTS